MVVLTVTGTTIDVTPFFSEVPFFGSSRPVPKATDDIMKLRESPTYILNEDTQLVMRAIGVSHTAWKRR